MADTCFLLANTATRLMFIQMPYLLFGNLVIGLLEGFVLMWLFKAPKRALGLMIGANYLSAIVGLVLFGLHTEGGFIQTVWRPTVVNYQAWIAMAIGLSFVLSVLVEWALCHVSFERTSRRVLRTFIACVIVQTVSYLFCLAPFSGLFAEIRIRDEVAIVDIASVVSADLPFWVYYIDPEDGGIYRMRPDGSTTDRFLEYDFDVRARLAVYDRDQLISSGRRFALCTQSSGPLWYSVLLGDFAASESAFRNPTDPDYASFDSLNSELAADLRSRPNREWVAQTRDYWGIRVARGDASDDPYDVLWNGQESNELTFTTAFGTWQGRNASILPGDIVIFELGGQICALDLNTRCLAFIRFGSGPVVVRDEGDGGPLSQPP